MNYPVMSLLIISIVAISRCAEKIESRTGPIRSGTVEIMSEGLAYPAYLAEPVEAGKMPAILLIHSFNGLEPGYLNISDDMANEGYVVLSPQWQTFNRTPADEILNWQ